MPEIRSDAPYATFINTFRCDPAHQDEVVAINVDIVEQVAARSPEFAAIAVRLAGLIEFDPHHCDVVHVRTVAAAEPG